MRKYIFIGIGGFLGAIFRLFIKLIPIQNYHELVPLNILFINITGSFILALITTVALEVLNMDSDLRLGICTGFLGAYTTFSTMCKEAITLIDKGYYFSAITYLTNSIFLGIAAAYLGVVVAREIVYKLVNRKNFNEV